jgi:hypothetical protein
LVSTAFVIQAFSYGKSIGPMPLDGMGLVLNLGDWFNGCSSGGVSTESGYENKKSYDE